MPVRLHVSSSLLSGRLRWHWMFTFYAKSCEFRYWSKPLRYKAHSTWSWNLLLENCSSNKILVCKKLAGNWKTLHNEEPHKLYASLIRSKGEGGWDERVM